MKKLLGIILVGFSISISANSCSKCGHCEFAGGQIGDKYCTRSNGQTDYDVAESYCENNGGTWNLE